ncbi:MAG: MerR family transcriptional regulator [Opitutales bacterium]|nr:MerR family transcriptional regulator [Opitutales bacterium]
MDKPHSINEFSKIVGLSAHTLRYYEKIGILPRIQRDWSGNRLYNEDDAHWVGFIKCLKSTGMPIEKIREYVELDEDEPDTIEARRKMLEQQLVEVKDRIAEYQHYSEVLEYKLQYFKDIVARTPARDRMGRK